MLLLGAITVFWPRPPSKVVAHAIQHLAAGILLSAIALELIPTIAAAKQKMSIVGMVVGFSLGSIVMITLPMLLDEDEEGEEEHGTEMSETAPGEGTNLMHDPAPSAQQPRAQSCDLAVATYAGTADVSPTFSVRTATSDHPAPTEPPPDQSLTFVQVLPYS